MASKMLRVALIALTVAHATAASDVLVINGPDDLTAAVKAHPFLAVEFYAPWCGHCKKLEPEWTKAAAALKKLNADVVLAKVDATAKSNTPLNAKFGVKGYPTIKLFRNGDEEAPKVYTGPREADGITAYLLKRAQPPSLLLTSQQEVDKFFSGKNDHDVAVLAFVPSEDSAALKAVQEAAEQLIDDISFAHVLDRSLVEECKKDCESPIAVMAKRDEEKKPRYEGEFSKTLLTTWAESHAAPLVGKFFQDDTPSLKSFQRSYKVPLPHVFVAFETRKEITPTVMAALTAAAEANDDLKFFVTAKDAGKNLLDFLGVPVEGPYPVFMVHVAATKTKHVKTGMKMDNLPEFVEEFKVGALEPYMKSEDPETVDTTGPVVVVTAKTYKEKVLNAGKAVFLELYAPWCGHCKKLEQPWTAVAKQLASNDNVIIAKMDATLNDLPDPRLTLESYPTLYWMPTDPQAKPVSYSGGREEEDLVTFVVAQLEKEGKSVITGSEAAAEKKDHDEL